MYKIASQATLDAGKESNSPEVTGIAERLADFYKLIKNDAAELNTLKQLFDSLITSKSNLPNNELQMKRAVRTALRLGELYSDLNQEQEAQRYYQVNNLDLKSKKFHYE